MTTVYISNSPAIKGAIYTFFVSLNSQANIGLFQTNPTLVDGDIRVSIDGGIAANITTMPVIIATATKILLVTLTAAEMNGNIITVLFCDAAGAEWEDAIFEIVTDSVIGIEAALAVDSVVDAMLNMTIGVTYAATITGLTIPATWTKVYLTVKENTSFDDTASMLQIMKTNPADAVNDGIMYQNKTVATALIKAMGSLTVTQAAGTVAIAITDNGMALIPAGLYNYDLKCLLADGSSQVLSASANCIVSYTVTHAL